MLGVVAIETTRAINFTQSFTSRFHRPVPLERPLQWRVWAADKSGKRTTMRGELLGSDGATLCSFEGAFVSAPFPYAPEPAMEAVRDAIAAESLQAFRLDPHGPWPPAASSIAARLVVAGFSPAVLHGAEGSTFEFRSSSAAKLHARLFISSEAAIMAAIIHFTPNSAGPPGRANGGAVLAAFNMVFEAAVQHLTLGDDLNGHPRLTELTARFRSAVPLGCVALLRCTVDQSPRPAAVAGAPPIGMPAHLPDAKLSLRLMGELLVPRSDGMVLSSDQRSDWADEAAVPACTATALCAPRSRAGPMSTRDRLVATGAQLDSDVTDGARTRGVCGVDSRHFSATSSRL